ncbi:hypothetical protein Neosp_013553 [[Neocosmospora] mangrovei]
MALDDCSDHAAEKMTLLDRPGRRPTVPISPISPGLAQDPIPQQKSEITPVPPSPTPPSDASDSHVEDTIVCAPVGHGLPWYPTSLEVVKHFGVEVVDCDAELADKNNTVALAVSQTSKKAPGSKAEEKTSPKKRLHESNDEPEVKEKEVSRRHTKQRRISGITRPTPGRIYLAYWETTKDWFPALILPHIGLEAFGIPSTLEKLGLMNSTPDCLRCEADTQNLNWREGYEHDGPHALDREFPVLFFDRRDFPEQASSGWVKASDLQELSVFKTSSRLVPNLKFAKKYLRKRLQQEAEFSDEDSKEDSWASSEESDSENPPENPSACATDDSPPMPTFTSVLLEPEQPAANVPESTTEEENVPLSENKELETGNAASMPLTPDESRPGTSSKPQAEATPTNPITRPITDDIELR